MFLLEPDRTPYDLNWQMFGIRVRVHPMFWLVNVVLGWSASHLGFSYLLLWVVCVFVSILVHELGHVFVGRMYGSDGHIVLYSFGGLAVGSNALSNRWQRIAVSFAGPWAGFVFLGLIVWLVSWFDPDLFARLVGLVQSGLGLEPHENVRTLRPISPPLVRAAVLYLFEINLFWGLLNLLPIWPLDGGQISRDLFEGYMRSGNGTRASLALSGALAALLAVNSLAAMADRPLLPFLPLGGFYIALLFGMLALGSFQAMQQVHVDRPWREDYPPWDRDRDRWER